MNTRWIKALIVVWQIVMTLLIQSVYPLSRLAVGVSPHEPLDDCALHQCGCNPDKQKRKSCCCHPESIAKASAPDEAKPFQQLIRAASCEGTSQPSLSLPGHYEFLTDSSPTLTPASFFTLSERLDDHVRDALMTEPPVPPPRGSLSA